MHELDRSKEWSKFVPLVQRIMITRVHSATGFAPATLKYGIENALELDLFVKPGNNSPLE